MSNLICRLGLLCAFNLMPVIAGVYPTSGPANQGASKVNALRNIGLGELRFSDPALYNLFDQGGSPMGLLETHSEHVHVGLGLLNSSRATSGDSLKLEHQDYFFPQIGFFQPGVFAAVLYYQKQGETYQTAYADTLKSSQSRFGLDLAAGPASGLFRIGFGAHALMGNLDYPGGDQRIVLGAPSLRLDISSRPVRDIEIGGFAAVSGRFDSLKAVSGRLDRIGSMSIPRFGFLADVDSLRELPITGNVIFEFGTDQQFGEYREANQPGVVYPTVWTGVWEMQTQWLYAAQWEEFQIQPSLRFAHRSEDAQGYIGIQANQNPLKKGDKINSLAWTHSMNDFGLGARFGYEEIANLYLEWENASHSFKSDTTVNRSYTRYSLGAETHLERIEALSFPEGISVALRAGWTFRQEDGSNPGYTDYQFNPFVPTAQVASRPGFSAPIPQNPQGYSSFHLGFGVGILENRLLLDGLLSFPGQNEMVRPFPRTENAAGMEFGIQATLRI